MRERQRGNNVQVYRGQGSMSKWYARAGKLSLSSRVLSKLSGRNLYTFNLAARLQCADGQQSAYDIIYSDQVPLNELFAKQLSEINPSIPNNTRRLLLRDVYGEIQFTNATNAVSYVQIYDLWYKREMDTTDNRTFVPSAAWNNGEIAQGNAAGCSVVGTYPTRVSLFNEYYRVARKTTHLLLPGEVHVHRVSLKPNKMITYDRAAQSVRYAGISAASMIVVKGTPVNNSGTTIGAQDPSGNYPAQGVDLSGNMISNLVTGQVTTSPCALDIVYNCRYTYQWMQDVDSDTVVSNSLTTGNTLEVMEGTGIAYPTIAV